MRKAVVTIQAEHSVTLPLWDDEGVMRAEEDWDLSADLRRDLMAWQQWWEDSSDEPERQSWWPEFVTEGLRLRALLQRELGDEYEVIVRA
jgi:hypothetical protein